MTHFYFKKVNKKLISEVKELKKQEIEKEMEIRPCSGIFVSLLRAILRNWKSRERMKKGTNYSFYLLFVVSGLVSNLQLPLVLEKKVTNFLPKMKI